MDSKRRSARLVRKAKRIPTYIPTARSTPPHTTRGGSTENPRPSGSVSEEQQLSHHSVPADCQKLTSDSGSYTGGYTTPHRTTLNSPSTTIFKLTKKSKFLLNQRSILESETSADKLSPSRSLHTPAISKNSARTDDGAPSLHSKSGSFSNETQKTAK